MLRRLRATNRANRVGQCSVTKLPSVEINFLNDLFPAEPVDPMNLDRATPHDVEASHVSTLPEQEFARIQ